MTVLASTAENAEDLIPGDVRSAEVLAAEERLQQLSFYEPNYENAVRSVQLARARQSASQSRRPQH